MARLADGAAVAQDGAEGVNWLVIATIAAGGVGAAARFLVDGWVPRVWSVGVPMGTLVINVTGSFALGVVTVAAGEGVLSAPLQMIAGPGLLAGYTTFSTASTQTSDLLTSGRRVAAGLYSGGMFAASLVAAAAGMWLAAVFW